MERVLTELTHECEITAQMYAAGYEKKEIASLKCRAVSTINNQLQEAFKILNVRNGRELAMKLAERLSGIKIQLDFSPTLRVAVSCFLLCLFLVDMQFEQQDMRRTRRTAKSERVYRTRTRRLET
ncbi:MULTISPECIES: response regulator transcription factor [Bacteroides]|uniref:response regulator transcription factor n=1 Tax=Bacteroides TaxID=816 RepID=UPI0005A6A6AE|nr:response regulator transcription factor [Bacteroides neonati]